MYSFDPVNNNFCTGPAGPTRQKMWTIVKSQVDTVDVAFQHERSKWQLIAQSQAQWAPDLTPPDLTLQDVTKQTHICKLALDCESLWMEMKQEMTMFRRELGISQVRE